MAHPSSPSGDLVPGGLMPALRFMLRQLLPLLAGLAVAAFAAGAFCWFAWHAFMNADAWAVYDMARSFDEAFYRGLMIRQYNQFPLDYGASYPFLGPVLLYLVDAASGLGMYSLYLVVAAAGWFGLLGMVALLRRGGGEGWSAAVVLAGLALLIAALNILEFYRDLYRASTIPLAFGLMVTALLLIPGRQPLTPARAFLVGLVLGLATETRFDVNLFVLGFTAVVFALAPGRRLAAAAAYAGGVALMALPWAAFSLTVFGRPYVSDNAIVAVTVKQLLSLDLVLPGELPTVFDDPAGWGKRVAAAGLDCLRILSGMLRDTPFAQLFLTLVPGLILLLPLWGGIAGRKPAAETEAETPQPPLRDRLTLTLTAIAGLLLLVGPVVTGYQMNTRYYSVTFLLGALLLLLWAHAAMRFAERRLGHGQPRLVFELGLAGLCVAGLAALPLEPFGDGWPRLAFNPANRTIEEGGLLARCVAPAGRTLLLFRYTNPALQDGIRFGTLARRVVLIMPNNWPELPSARKLAFLRDARVSHILLDPAESTDGLLDPGMTLEPVADCPGSYRLP